MSKKSVKCKCGFNYVSKKGENCHVCIHREETEKNGKVPVGA